MNLPIDSWLNGIATHLRGKGQECRLVYDDVRGGQFLALAAPTGQGLVELDVHRTRTGAILILCADTPAALAVFADKLGELHRTVKRLANARRKFVHRVETLAQHLAQTYDERAREFPHEPFGRLQQLIPEGAAMTGAEATFREREHEPEAVSFASENTEKTLARLARRFPSRFAAKIPTPAGGRAALYQPEGSLFRVQGEAQDQLAARLAAHPGRPASDFAVNEPKRRTGPPPAQGDAPAAASVVFCGDCGGLDLPDCDVIQMPDCGGCDISF
jgi:hypothetical protein